MRITIHIKEYGMRTNIVLDDGLVSEAFKYAQNTHTRREPIEAALKEFVATRKVKNLRELKGNYGLVILVNPFRTHYPNKRK